MSAAPWSAAAGAPALAAAVYAEPTRFADLVKGGGTLPDDAVAVMRTAAEAVRIGRPELLSGAQRAALFFVEHVLLGHEADHYRVLGLNRDATGEQIREHYRIMMGIFHPDRRGWADGDREKLSARINLAHQVLRDDYRRASYDLERIQARPRATAPAPKAVAARTRIHRPAPATSCADRIPLTVRRHFPQYVLGSVALVGLVAVLTVYLNRAPTGAIGASRVPRPPAVAIPSEPPATTAAAEPAVRPAAKLAAGAGGAPAAAAPSAVISAPKPSASAAPLPAAAGGAEASRAAPAPIPAVPAQPEAVLVAVRTAPPASEPRAPDPATDREAARPAPGAAATSAGAEVRPPLAPAATPQPVEAAAKSEPVRPPAATAVERRPTPAVEEGAAAAGQAAETPPAAPVAPTATDTSRVLSQFSLSYQLGDIERFMGLFADDARSEAGRKPQIRKDYEQLFRTTQARHIELVDMRWSRASAAAHGEGGYLVRVTRKGEGAEETFAGSIRLELTRRGGDVLISGLFHKPSN